MAKKATTKKSARRDAQQQQEAARAMVEELDLEVDDERYADEVAVVHNKRPRRHTNDTDTHSNDDDDDDDVALTSVLPSDAHRLDGYGVDEHGDYDEEEQLAMATEREQRRRTDDADFDVAGVSVAAVAAAAAAHTRARDADATHGLHATPVIEAVERDFAALSTRERMAVLSREAPELLPMLRDLQTYLADVKQLAAPLHELLYERKVADEDKHLVSFLETKVQLMLSYCMHVTFYLLLKTSGQKVSGHPVVDHLVEVRVYLEKLWPLEEKLQYSLNRLLSGRRGAAAHVSELRPVQDDDVAAAGGGAEVVFARSAHDADARERRRVLRQMRDAEELEREEQATMTRARTRAAAQLNAAAARAAATTSSSGGKTASSGGGMAETIAPLSYREDEDQYFAKLTAARAAHAEDGDDDKDADEVGLSLMERLRRHHKAMQQQQQQQQQKKKQQQQPGRASRAQADDDHDDDEGDNADSEVDVISDEDDAAVPVDARAEATYAALVREEQARAAAQRDTAADDDGDADDDEGAQAARATKTTRRKATKRMESHRGLTKARPRDRKNPRVAQRRKYERGMRVHKAHVRSHQPEPEGGFAGVQSLKPGVVRSVKLQ